MWWVIGGTLVIIVRCWDSLWFILKPNERWPLTKRIWFILSSFTGRLQYRIGLEEGWHRNDYGVGLHVNDSHWSSRLNKWVQSHWVDWWIETSLAQSEARRADDHD